MSLQMHTRRQPRGDEPEPFVPWSILPVTGTLSERRPSTTTRLGRPFAVREVDDLLQSAEQVTVASVGSGRQFWQTYITSTETGITFSGAPRPVREDVQKLRDEVAQRTRLTREQMARAVGVDRRSLSDWVRGVTTPSADKVERLRLLADVVRDIDATEPGRSTEVLLSRTGGRDLLDRIADGRLARASDWQALQGVAPSVTVERRPTRRPLYQKALEAYLRGELRPIGRATTVRPESDYEQDLSQAERLMPYEPARRSRPGYR